MANKELGIAEADDSLRRGLDELLELEEAQLTRLASLLSSPESAIPDSLNELRRLSVESELDFQLLYRTVPTVRYLLSAWRNAGFSLEEVLSDLGKSGISADKIERCKVFLQPLEASKERYFANSLQNRLELVGGPTIDDLNLVWDVRPIFSSTGYPADSNEESEAEWVGHTYVLLMEISASRRDGQRESTTLQLNERDFDQFERAIIRARQQLDVLKGKRFS